MTLKAFAFSLRNRPMHGISLAKFPMVLLVGSALPSSVAAAAQDIRAFEYFLGKRRTIDLAADLRGLA